MNRKSAKKFKLPPHQELEQGLMYLNHTTQYHSFQSLTKKSNNVVGIRIKTSTAPTIPLVWLLKCLLKNPDTSYFQFGLRTFVGENNNFEKLLDSIYRKIVKKESNGKDKTKIIQEIYHEIQEYERNIVFIFYDVDKKPKDFLDQLKSFWHDLRDKVQSDCYLLMLWVDYQEDRNDWREVYNFPQQVDECWVCTDLLDLSIQKNFKKKELASWVNSHSCPFSKIDEKLTVNQEAIKHTIESIWKDSQRGKAEALLKEIYTKCGLTWEEHKSKWQNF